MIRLLGIATAILLAGAAALSANAKVDWNHVAIFPPDRAQQLATQCSRPAPGPVQGTWSVPPTLVASIESALPKVFEAEFANWAKHYGYDPQRDQTSFSEYLRQYGGLVVSGRRIVYVAASLVDSSERRTSDWQKAAIAICDGGPRSFGVEYDPHTKKFSNFQFNGVV